MWFTILTDPLFLLQASNHPDAPAFFPLITAKFGLLRPYFNLEKAYLLDYFLAFLT
jgi:hypothetical protein